MPERLLPKRNDKILDTWSVIHLVTGVTLGWVITPFVALAIMVLWEPLEIFVLSPIMASIGITFGFETLRNSLSDILFDTIGVIIGAYVLASMFAPPFHLF